MPEDQENEIPEVFPEGVELHSFDDVDYWRDHIYDRVKTSLSETFPRSYGNVTLELADLDWADPDRRTPEEERTASLNRGTLMRRLRGTVTLKDRETGEVLDSTQKTIMGVPYLTGRGVFIHKGSNYTSARQARLEPGVFSRRRANGELETHFNLAPQTGKPFRVVFEPESMLFRMNLGGSSLKLYSILHDLGVDDQKLRDAWGDTVFSANQKRYDRGDINKLFDKLLPYEESESMSPDEKIAKLREKLLSGKLSRRIVQQTLGTHLDG